MKKLLIICFINSLGFTQGFNKNDSIIKLQTINIYGLSVNSSNSGRNTTTISASEIQKYSFHSIDGLIKLMPSIELQSRGGFGAQADIVLRGTTFNQSLVLLDGVRVNDPLTGHFSMYIPISPFEIYKIQIIRGGGSSIYGPDAVGGVINIITKSFSKSFNEHELIIESKFGENRLGGANVVFAKSINNKLYSSFSMNLIKSDGQELYPNHSSFFEHQTFSLSHKYHPKENICLAIRSALSKHFFDSKYFYTRSTFDQSNELIEKKWAQMNISWTLNNISEINLYSLYQNVSDEYVFNPNFPSYSNQTELINGKIHYINQNTNHKMIGGLDFQNRKITSLDRGNHADNYFGGFINLIKTWDRLTINPSLRVDYNESYNTQITPQFDVNLQLENYVLRACVGRSIRSADFTERFYNNNYLDTLSEGRNIGNPNLNAEESINFEAGIDYNKNRFFNSKSTVFYRNSKNLIDWTLVNANDIITNVNLYPDVYYLYAQNISALKTLGFETELWFQSIQISSIKINGSIGYTKIFSGSTFKSMFDGGQSIASKYLANSSGSRLNYNLFLNFSNIEFNLSGLFKLRESDFDSVIEQELEQSYFVQNLKINYNVTNNISYGLEIINLFDEDYSEILGALMPKRWAILSIKIQI